MLVRRRALEHALDDPRDALVRQRDLLAELVDVVVHQTLHTGVSPAPAAHAATHRVVRDDDADAVLGLDAVHAAEPLGPLIRVHRREDDGAGGLAVLPLLRDRARALPHAGQLGLGRGDEHNERLVRGVHDLLEVVRVEFDVRRELVAHEL